MTYDLKDLIPNKYMFSIIVAVVAHIALFPSPNCFSAHFHNFSVNSLNGFLLAEKVIYFLDPEFSIGKCEKMMQSNPPQLSYLCCFYCF